MIFELTNENVRTAIQDYCTKMGITAPIENVQFKVARKGNKGTTALVTVAAKPTPSVQLELPFDELVNDPIPADVKEDIKEFFEHIPVDIQKVTEDVKEFIFNTPEIEKEYEPEPVPTTQSPFKKLF
jgi:hypothetical protein